MTSRLHLIIYIILLAFPLAVQAQDDSGRSIYDEAEREYKIGRVEQARDLLLNNIGTFKNSLQERAYKLLTVCYLGLCHQTAETRPLFYAVAAGPSALYRPDRRHQVGTDDYHHHGLEPG